MLGKYGSRTLAGEIVAGEHPDLWKVLSEKYKITEDTCTIAQLIKILDQEEPRDIIIKLIRLRLGSKN